MYYNFIKCLVFNNIKKKHCMNNLFCYNFAYFNEFYLNRKIETQVKQSYLCIYFKLQ